LGQLTMNSFGVAGRFGEAESDGDWKQAEGELAALLATAKARRFMLGQPRSISETDAKRPPCAIWATGGRRK
jgi:hypothetical protein